MNVDDFFKGRYPRCLANGKLMYPTKGIALSEGKRLARHHGQGNVNPKAFPCEAAAEGEEHFHVTNTGKGKRGRRT